jgi:cell division protein FtsQ
MDGGGRLLRSLSSVLLGAGSASRHKTALPVLGGDRPRRFFGFGRRSSVVLPLHERIPNGLGTWLTGALALAIAISGASYGDHFRTFRDNYGEPKDTLARLVGLGVDRITISGIAELDEHEVLSAAGISPRGSLVFLDVNEARKGLEANPLVREASVRKLYPGEVTISLVEREPAAIWQLNGELFLVSADGTVIDQMRDGRFVHLPLVVGDGANHKARDYAALLTHAGPLRSRIRGAVLVSGRRWTLKMDNGLDVRLPEQGAAEALKRLVSLEKEHRVLDRDVLAIDMRQTDRITFRLTEEAASARADMLKTKTKKKAGEA